MARAIVYNTAMSTQRFGGLPACFLGLLLLTGSARCAFADSAPAALPSALTVAAGPGTRLTDPATALYDFGARRLSDESPLVHTFVLQNGGGVPLTLDRTESSCGCTSAALGGGQALPVTISPHGVADLQVSVLRHRLLPGPMQKMVWVYGHAAGGPTVSVLLEVMGTLQDDSPAAPRAAPSPATPPGASAAPRVGRIALAFTRPDTAGRPFVLTAHRGRPLAVFFFCGCPWCADLARSWGRLQRAARLPVRTETVVVFAGDKAAASAFAAKNGLDLAQTRLLPDPNSSLTENVYRLAACPRAFALDARGTVRYTNDHADDQARQAPAATLAARTLAALRQTGRTAAR